MSDPDLSTILDDLAAGRIDAVEAARRIDARKIQDDPARPAADLSGDRTGDVWAGATDDVPARPAGDSDAVLDPVLDPVLRPTGSRERLTVRAVGRRVKIMGDPTVATVSVRGQHVIKRNGSVTEVAGDGEVAGSQDGFAWSRAPRNLEEFRSLGLGKELLVRVNPNVVVDAEVTAGSLTTERVPDLGRVRVTAGSARLLDVEQVEDALVQAGQTTLHGTFRTGRSRVRAESGTLTVQLGDRSDVTVRAEVQLGRVTWSGRAEGGSPEVVMGTGAAELDLSVVMGYAQVAVGSVRPADVL